MADDKGTAKRDGPGLGDAYALTSPDDNRALYRSWAATYDSGFAGGHGYRYPQAIAQICHDRMPEQARGGAILDVGCGTGLVGKALRALFPDAALDGLDLSPEMLAVAAGKRVYRALFECDLTAPGTLPGGYDAVVSAGTFTHGHVGPEVMPKLIDSARPGGLFVIGVNARFFADMAFDTVVAKLVADRRITPPEMIEGRVYDQAATHDHANDRFLALVFSAVQT